MRENHLDILGSLEQRRRDLGLPYGVLSLRAKLGIATVQRTLSGATEARIDTLIAIARVLGVSVALGTDTRVMETVAIDDMLRRRAQEKARLLAGLAQGSAGLEGQAVSQEALHRAVEALERKLLAGSKRKLWES